MEFIRDQYIEWMRPDFNSAMFGYYRSCGIDEWLDYVAMWRGL